MLFTRRLFVALGLGLALLANAQAQPRRFVFGPPVAAGETADSAVTADTVYTATRGYGFEPGTGTTYFSVDVPEGAWRVTALLGGTREASDTTIKAELRRLMLQGVVTKPGQTVQQSFTVHVRRPEFPGGRVALREPRESVGEAWNWDGKLTLEISGRHPALRALAIEPVSVPTVFLLGDSTVADQASEPYASWGQMLPRWFGPGAAVVSLAQSGETYRDSLQRRRLDKILSLAKAGDVVLMQYGHNDQKQLRDGSGSVQTYQDEIRQHLKQLQAAKLLPVIVTSVERRFFESDGSLRRTLADYVDAARSAAQAAGVPVIDLNALSRTLYLALGPQTAPYLFAKGADGRVDPTHHNNDGAWLLAGLVAQQLRELKLPIAAQLRADAPRIDPQEPGQPGTYGIAASPSRTEQRPAGDEATRPTLPKGWSAERLARVDAAVNDEIAKGRLPGALVLIQRDGQLVHQGLYGQMDVEGKQPMRADTMFRLASMTKAVTTVAALMLYEEGRFLLRDPISKWLPAFADMQVAVNGPGGPDGARLEKARRPITVRDLLMHTAGLSYGAGPAESTWKQAGFNDWYLLGNDESLAQWTDRLAKLPLQAHPGESYQYGYSTDVLGRLVEVWSGMPFERFVAERITGPLKMADTHFWVPPDKASRLANVYGLEHGRLVLKETSARSDFIDGPRKLASGGAGLVSTAGDYARLLQMLLNGGQLDGVRLLSPATVTMMSRDQTTPRGINNYSADGEAGGFGFWVQKSPGARSELGSEGAFGWGSAYAPQYLVDPKERLIVIFMTQLRPAGDSTLNQRVKVLARQALME